MKAQIRLYAQGDMQLGQTITLIRYMLGLIATLSNCSISRTYLARQKKNNKKMKPGLTRSHRYCISIPQWDSSDRLTNVKFGIFFHEQKFTSLLHFTDSILTYRYKENGNNNKIHLYIHFRTKLINRFMGIKTSLDKHINPL